MGSLGDVYFSPVNGNAETDEQAARLNDRFGELSGAVYRTSKDLRREHDRA